MEKLPNNMTPEEFARQVLYQSEESKIEDKILYHQKQIAILTKKLEKEKRRYSSYSEEDLKNNLSN